MREKEKRLPRRDGKVGDCHSTLLDHISKVKRKFLLHLNLKSSSNFKTDIFNLFLFYSCHIIGKWFGVSADVLESLSNKITHYNDNSPSTICSKTHWLWEVSLFTKTQPQPSKRQVRLLINNSVHWPPHTFMWYLS